MNFKELVKWFKNKGYELVVSEESLPDPNNPYLFATTFYPKDGYYNKQELRIGFCEPNDGKSYWYIDGRIAIDREDCFDKWSKCPVNLPFPENEKQLQFLLDKMNWLKTDEGYKVSNEYDFDNWIKEYPI